MNDTYEYLNTKDPEFSCKTFKITELNADKLLSSVAGRNGALTESFSATVTGHSLFEETWILSTTAKYETVSGEIPVVQVRITDEAGNTLYYSPVYEIGHTRAFYRREWRIPPTIEYYQTIQLTFIIPKGVTLYLREIKGKRNSYVYKKSFGILHHGHAGFPSYASSNTAFSFQMAAEMGFSSCITIPKFTKDGVGVCFHDDGSIRKKVRYEDGSKIEEGSPDEYFKICASTGMKPIFSVHPGLSIPEWEKVRLMLEKYKLLDQFWIKTGSISRQKNALEVFGNDIGGHILIQGVKSSWDPAEQAKECGFDRNKQKVVIEYFYLGATEEKIRLAKNEGFDVSIATTRGGFSGPDMRKLIGMGVTEFTSDHHCSMGLDW